MLLLHVNADNDDIWKAVTQYARYGVHELGHRAMSHDDA